MAFLSCSENVHSDTLDPLVTLNRNRSPSGDHDSGTWDVPWSGFVSRSAAPVPSARCQKMPRSPSRSDWNATRWPSADQMGKRFLPSERESPHRRSCRTGRKSR